MDILFIEPHKNSGNSLSIQQDFDTSKKTSTFHKNLDGFGHSPFEWGVDRGS